MLKQVPQLGKKARVWDGTAWQELASAQTDLTLAQIGTGGKRNADLMDLEVPIAERIDPVTGERISEVQTVKQILDDFEQDKSMLERLVGCVK